MIDIAIQLYTVRDRTASDMAGTIRALGDIGYKYVGNYSDLGVWGFL